MRVLMIVLLLLAACAKKPDATPDAGPDVKAELVAYLGSTHPEWRVSVRDETLLIDVGGGIATRIELAEVAKLTAERADPAARATVYAQFVDAIGAQVKDRKVTLEQDGDRLMPKVVAEGFFATLPADTVLPRRALGETGLSIIFVLDSPQSVAYVTEAQRAQLGLDEGALYARALANLSKTLGGDTFSAAFESGKIITIRKSDGYDAARVLLIPGSLGEGQQLAAMIPDKDVLMLAPVPKDGDWTSLQAMAKVANGAVLLDRPLLVTRSGFELK